MKHRVLTVLLILVFLCAGVTAAEERALVSTATTADWEPPDLTAFEDISAPELLVLKVAQEEIGYTEGPLSNQTKYGEWFCGGRVSWCAEFLTWCVDQVDRRYGTELMDTVFPRYGGPSTGAPFFMEKGRFISDDGKIPTSGMLQWLTGSDHYLEPNEYIPYPGDYIWFYYYSRYEGTDHVALVEGVSKDEDGNIVVHVIEGNNPDSVQRAEYGLTDKSIYGYGTPVRRAYSNLRLYVEGDDVLSLQSDLISLGYYTMEEGQEGFFSEAVQAAVKQLQHDAGLAADGVVDMDIHNTIEVLLAGSTQ
jgi:hypothetical protein